MPKIEPSQRYEYRALRSANKRLEAENAQLKEEVASLREMIFTQGIPDHIREWMREFDLPFWEVFYCHQHKEWYTELDSAFPYFHEGCACPKCLSEK